GRALDGLLGAREVAVGGDDGRAFARERQRGGAPDSGATAGDQAHFPIQSQIAGHAPTSPRARPLPRARSAEHSAAVSGGAKNEGPVTMILRSVRLSDQGAIRASRVSASS